ncbi:hypothetical protein [Sporisorium scitamineum]|uniref:Uncharacterized protein n=1 Tax=Sporisorium scitamineum TaxID=49012 RepID=A0A0F7S1N2_9BASI|nr:hypothetical protein [Sporisorium scitamineum]
MPPKRKTAPSAGSSTSRPAAKKSTKTRQPARRPKLAAQLDMYIRRSDDEDESEDDAPGESSSSKQQSAKSKLIAAQQEQEYEPESDEASYVSSGDDASDADSDAEGGKVRTVSTANLAFLSGLDKNRAIDVSQKDAKQKAKDLKRSDRKEFEETRKRIAAEKKLRLTQPPSDDEEDDFSDADMKEDEKEEVELVRKGEKKNYQEYSDVSEGEEVGASSDDEEPVKRQKTKRVDDEDAEAAYLARLGKRKARQQYEDEVERQKRVNAKLPVRKLDGEIASLSSQIVADPENNLGLLKRLAVFASATITAPPEKIPEIRAEQAAAKARGEANTARPVKVQAPPAVRQLAMLSMLAVFVDVLPGYRIRSLTEKEQEEKVGQEVARRREFEAGLVGVYRDFLEMCEAELKAAAAAAAQSTTAASKGEPGVGKLGKAAVKVFTTLAVRAVHFNFRTNILGIVVARMSRRRWGPDENDCFQAIRTVILDDLTGEISLEVVRLIHRMTKERRYKVNSQVLDLLLHLRLRDELSNKRSSTTTSTDPDADAARAAREHAERRAAMKAREKLGKAGGKFSSKEVRKGLATHLSKKQVKKQKELKAIEDEMKEAEATVDLEERERNQTETLKLVFVLYFTVLKREVGTVGLGVLESTMKGLSMYAHRVNVDFFRDLLAVLKQHVAVNAALLHEHKSSLSLPDEEEGEEGSDSDSDARNVLLDQTTLTKTIRHMILALKTTFDLFLNQVEGTILNLDLTDVLGHFYYALFFLPFVNESHLSFTSSSSSTVVDLALDSLYSILIRNRTRFPPHILASFAKRLSIITLHLPPQSSKKVLRIVAHLLTHQSTSTSSVSQLALLDLEDRSRNGRYAKEGGNLNTSGVLESGQTILWELCQLKRGGNAEVVEEADRVWGLKDEAL